MKVIAVLALVLGGLGAAPAATSTFTYTNLTVDTAVTPTAWTPVVARSFPLQAGEQRRLMDRVEVTISSSQGAEVDNGIFCTDPVGAEFEGGGTSSGTNHRGSAAGSIVLQENLLLRASVTGTYRCEVRVRAGDPRTGYHLTVLARGTWLQASATDEVGATVRYASRCASVGTLPCTYFGGPLPASAWAFPDAAAEANLWTVGAGTTDVDVAGTVQVTSCTENTRSCTDGPHGHDDFSRLQSFLMVDQLYPDRSVCRTWYSTDPDADVGNRYSIPNSVHHLPIHYYLSVPVSPNCLGSRTFRLNVFEGWDSGNPLKLDAGTLVAIQRVRTTTATVPGVVGTTQAQAAATLQGQGFTSSALGVLSTAPAGTVLAQNSPGGTVEPTGSLVRLTVSQGGSVVPSVVNATRTAATSALTGAGLTVGTVGSVTTDSQADDNRVLSQSVAPGTLVAPGTVVNLVVWHYVPNHCGPSAC